jgi:hypothetical protein
MLRIDFQCDDAPARRKRASQPDRAVAAERADLQNVRSTTHPREQMQKLALRRCDSNFGQTGCNASRQRRIKLRI